MKEEKTQKTLNTYTTNARREQKRWLGFFTGSFLRGLQSLKTSRMSADDLFQKWKKSESSPLTKQIFHRKLGSKASTLFKAPLIPRPRAFHLNLSSATDALRGSHLCQGSQTHPQLIKHMISALSCSFCLVILILATQEKSLPGEKKKTRVWNRREKQQSRISSSRCFNQAPGQKMF